MAAFVVFLLVSILAGPAFSACPPSDLSFGNPEPFTSTESALDSNVVSGGEVSGRVAYDLLAGTLTLVHGGGLSETFVVARDLYDISGVPAGTPVLVTVELAARGMVSSPGCGGAGCHGVLTGAIAAEGERVEQVAIGTVFQPGQVPVEVAPRQVVRLVAGAPTLIAFELRGRRTPGGNHRVEAGGTFRFLGLPPGASIVSCQGFTGSPTPTASASWGRVKASYR